MRWVETASHAANSETPLSLSALQTRSPLLSGPLVVWVPGRLSDIRRGARRHWHWPGGCCSFHGSCFPGVPPPVPPGGGRAFCPVQQGAHLVSGNLAACEAPDSPPPTGKSLHSWGTLPGQPCLDQERWQGSLDTGQRPNMVLWTPGRGVGSSRTRGPGSWAVPTWQQAGTRQNQDFFGLFCFQ